MVNNDLVHFNEVWYNHQKTPKPGGEKYEVRLSLSEKMIFKQLKRLVEKDVEDKGFLDSMLKYTESTINPVDIIISLEFVQNR